MTPDDTRPRNPSAEPYYLPMDCPVCGRRRMEWDGKVLSCEKCNTSSEYDGFNSDDYAERARYAALVAAARFMLESAPANPRAFECKVITSRLLALRAALDGEPSDD